MADNEKVIKQIKVGNITYNIEPYTNYLPLSGGVMDVEAWIKFYSSPTLDVEYMTDIRSEGVDLTHVTSDRDKITELRGGNLVISENSSDGVHGQIDISSTQIAFTKGLTADSSSTIRLYSSSDNTLMTTGNLAFMDSHGIKVSAGNNGFYGCHDYPVIASDDRSLGVSADNCETVEWFYFPETNGDGGELVVAESLPEKIMEAVNENSTPVETLNIGTSTNYHDTSDSEIPTTKAVKAMIESLVNNALEADY